MEATQAALTAMPETMAATMTGFGNRRGDLGCGVGQQLCHVVSQAAPAEHHDAEQPDSQERHTLMPRPRASLLAWAPPTPQGRCQSQCRQAATAAQSGRGQQ